MFHLNFFFRLCYANRTETGYARGELMFYTLEFLDKLQSIFGSDLPRTQGQFALFYKWSKELEEKNGPESLEEHKDLLLAEWEYIKGG